MSAEPTVKLDSHDRLRDGGAKPLRDSVSDAQRLESNEGNELHLPNLVVSGFRGINSLRVPSLKRVTLFVGKNGVGKTTLLEAIRIYASRGKASELANILRNRGEISAAINEEREEIDSPNLPALFYGRDIENKQTISIGITDSLKQVKIQTKLLESDELRELGLYDFDSFVYRKAWQLQTSYGQTKFTIPWIYALTSTGASSMFFWRSYRRPSRRLSWQKLATFEEFEEVAEAPIEVQCFNLGPSLMSSRSIAQLWGKIALTDDEEQAVDALKLVFGNDIQRVAVVSRDDAMSRKHRFDVSVRIRGLANPVPLQSLGDGAIRFFGTGLALATSRNGFLTIDEAENGIHHSLHRDYWRMILQMACNNNIQVIATTHGWDCVRGFAQAVSEMEHTEGTLIRLEESKGDLRAVPYSSDDLLTAAVQGIEMR